MTDTPPPPPPPPPPEPTTEESGGGDGGGRPVVRLLVQGALALAFLAAGGGLAFFLFEQKTAPAQADRLDATPVVRVAPVTVGGEAVTVRGYGQVRARDAVQIVPQVAGRVLESAPDFVVGGTLPGGSVVLRLDPTDAELDVRQQEAELARIDASIRRLISRRAATAAAVARAETRLATERAEAQVARAEFERLNPGRDVPPLVAREPQVAEAEADLAAAGADAEDVELQREELLAQRQSVEARLERAKEDLRRTEVTLPGDADDRYRVTAKSAEVGQFVTAGLPVGSVYDSAALEVPVPLAARDLRWFDIPGAAATLTDPATGRDWPGTVARTQGEINPNSRLTDVVVMADAPTGTDGLVPGLFVEATITGRELADVAAIPRLALRRPADGARGQRTGGTAGEQVVYLAGPDDLLRIVPVTVERLDRERALVTGLTAGDRVILTDLDLVTPNMSVRVVE